jgi:lipoprotein-releasing system permease protein
VLRLALAYLFRRPVQLLAVFGVAIGLLALLVVTSVMNGLIQHDRDSVRGPLADLMLVPAVEESPAQWLDYENLLESLPEIEAAAPHLVAYAVLGMQGAEMRMSSTGSTDLNGVQIVGIDSAAEARVSEWLESLDFAQRAPVDDTRAPFALSSDIDFPRPGVLVSDQLSQILPIGANSVPLANGQSGYLPLQLGALPPLLPAADQEFRPHNAEFFVAGTYHGSDYQMSLDRIYMQRMGRDGLHYNLLGKGAPDFTEALLKLAPGVSSDSAKSAIFKALAAADLPKPGGPSGGSLETWQERRALYLGAIENERRITGLIMSFIVLVAAFGLFTTLSSLVREKIRDLGVLAALGFSPLHRAGLLMATGAVASFLGVSLGYFGAHSLIQHRQAVELFLQEHFDLTLFDSSIYVIQGIPARWDSSETASLALGAFALGILFTLAPAIRAARLSPVEALRYE